MSYLLRAGVISPEQVFPYVSRAPRTWFGKSVRMGSTRYKLFKQKGMTCVRCGIEGKFFAVERHRADKQQPNNYHLNLYAIDKHGSEVLMTRDHIIPRACGGPDCLGNYQVMCTRCNSQKGADLEKGQAFQLMLTRQDHYTLKLASNVLEKSMSDILRDAIQSLAKELSIGEPDA